MRHPIVTVAVVAATVVALDLLDTRAITTRRHDLPWRNGHTGHAPAPPI